MTGCAPGTLPSKRTRRIAAFYSFRCQRYAYARSQGPLSGFLLNDAVNVEKTTRIRINWGIIQYPVDVSYQRKVNNEALMLYVFFGSEKISSGHMLIPNSPYFIGLFLCQDEQIDFPYKGRYFHAGGRFVCLGKPKPNETVVSEFDLDTAFKKYFDKSRTPGITGIGFGIDTSKAGRGGAAAAFIKSIEFIGADGADAVHAPGANRAQTASRVQQGGTEIGQYAFRQPRLGTRWPSSQKSARRRLLELPALRPRLQPSCDWSPTSFDLTSGNVLNRFFPLLFDCEYPRRGAIVRRRAGESRTRTWRVGARLPLRI